MENGKNVNKKSRFNEDFWQEYRTLVVKTGVPSHKAEWYVKWSVRFAGSQPNLPLKARTAEDVKNFLNNFKQNVSIKEWQVDQATEALRFLFKEFLKLAWAEKWTNIICDINGISSLRNPNQQEPLIINSFRDSSTSKEVVCFSLK